MTFSQNAFAVITALDLDPIKVKLMHKESGEGWSLAKVNAVEMEYRRFLYLMKSFPNEKTAPLVDVDTFWHYHILDTMKYAADCEHVFGYFLHHFPYLGMRGEEDEKRLHKSGERLRELYEACFGTSYAQAAAALAETDQLANTGALRGVTGAKANFRDATAIMPAWCLATDDKAASRSAIGAGAAWCLATDDAAASHRGIGAKAAWCLATDDKAASHSAIGAGAAWCLATDDGAASHRGFGAKAAWCLATDDKAASHSAIGAKAAWCLATDDEAASRSASRTKAAWCLATDDKAASRSAIGAKAAWCLTTDDKAAVGGGIESSLDDGFDTTRPTLASM
jgi:hypothetical protein